MSGSVSPGGLIKAGACVWKCEIILPRQEERAHMLWNSGSVLFDNHPILGKVRLDHETIYANWAMHADWVDVR